jgi:hypothetical protein
MRKWPMKFMNYKTASKYRFGMIGELKLQWKKFFNRCERKMKQMEFDIHFYRKTDKKK